MLKWLPGLPKARTRTSAGHRHSDLDRNRDGTQPQQRSNATGALSRSCAVGGSQRRCRRVSRGSEAVFAAGAKADPRRHEPDQDARAAATIESAVSPRLDVRGPVPADAGRGTLGCGVRCVVRRDAAEAFKCWLPTGSRGANPAPVSAVVPDRRIWVAEMAPGSRSQTVLTFLKSDRRPKPD